MSPCWSSGTATVQRSLHRPREAAEASSHTESPASSLGSEQRSGFSVPALLPTALCLYTAEFDLLLPVAPWLPGQGVLEGETNTETREAFPTSREVTAADTWDV